MKRSITTIFFVLSVIFLSLSPAAMAQDNPPLAQPPQPTAGELMSQYRFSEAASSLRRQIAAAKETGNPVGRLEKTLRRATLGESMLRGTARVTIIDSIVCPRKALFNVLRLCEECGHIAPTEDFGNLGFTPTGATVFRNALQTTLFFATSSASGKKKLHSSNRLSSGGWTMPEPLAGLAAGDDTQDYPFVCADGRTVYFAAQGDESLGGYDIFVTRYDTETRSFLRPENVGMPFNSPANDFLMVIDDATKLGWFVTDRRQPADKVCVYCFVPDESREVFSDGSKNGALLRRAARLERIADFQTDAEATAAAKKRLATLGNGKQRRARTEGEFIVVNNELVYASASAFRNENARRIAQQWEEAKLKQETDLDTLEKLRLQYAAGDADAQATLRQEILRLEKETAEAAYSLRTMEKNMRRAELGQ